MTEKDNHPIRNGVIATVLGGLILAYIPYTRAVAVSLGSVLWQGLVKGSTVIWTYFASTATMPWLVVWGLIALSVPTVWCIAKRCIPKRDRGPTIQDYTSDFFFGVNWRWTYQWGNNPACIAPFCPICSTRLVFVRNILDHNTTLRCETCNHDVVTLDGEPHFVVDGTIARQIERRINTGEWKRIVQRSAENQPAN